MKIKSLLCMCAIGFGLTGMTVQPVYGEETVGGSQKTDTPKITKVVQGNVGSAMPEKTFAFTFAPVDTETVKANDSINISAVRITLAKDADKTEARGTAAIALPAYTRAGVYAYTVKETALSDGGWESEEGHVICDASAYTMYVYVNNTDTGVKVSTVTAADKDGNKADWTDGMVFTNRFVRKAKPGAAETDLQITKKVQGAYGDKTKAFNFTVTLTKAAVMPEDWTFDSVEMMYGSQKGTGTPAEDGNSAVYTFRLKDGESASFVHLPAGMKYSVKEEGVQGFAPSFENLNGNTRQNINGTESKDLITEEYVIRDSGNTGTMTNTFKDISVTGIFTDNAPFIVMTALAVIGIAVYEKLKRTHLHV